MVFFAATGIELLYVVQFITSIGQELRSERYIGDREVGIWLDR
ncbi:hypothetical protein [Microcoleus sp. B9-D4]